MSTFLKSVHNINARREALLENQRLTDEARYRGQLPNPHQSVIQNPMEDEELQFSPYQGIWEGSESALIAPSQAKARLNDIENATQALARPFNYENAENLVTPGSGIIGRAGDLAGSAIHGVWDAAAGVGGTLGYWARGGGETFGAIGNLDEKQNEVATKFYKYIDAELKTKKAKESYEEAYRNGRITKATRDRAIKEAEEGLKEAFKFSKDELEVLETPVNFRGGEESVREVAIREYYAQDAKDWAAGNEEKGYANAFLGTEDLVKGANERHNITKQQYEAIQKSLGVDENSSGFGKWAKQALAGATAYAQNPSTVANVVAEDVLPWVLGGAPGVTIGVAQAGSQSFDTFDEAKKANLERGGNLNMDSDAYNAALGWSAAQAAFELGGDTAMRAFIGTSPLGKFLRKTGDAAPDGILGKAAGVAGRTAGASITEGISEGFSSYAGERAKMNENINSSDVIFEAMAGSAAGGSMSAANEAYTPIKNAASFGLDKATQIGPLKKAKEAYDGYRETKIQSNMSDADFFDVGNENYNPAVPFDRLYSSLTEASDLASIETKEAELNSLYESATQAAEAEVSRYEQVRDIDQSIEKIEELIAKETDEEKKAKLEETLGKYVHTRDNVDLDVLKQIADKASAGQEAADAAYVKARTQLRTARKKAEVNASTESTYIPLTNEEVAGSSDTRNAFGYLAEQAKQTTNLGDLNNILTDIDKVQTVHGLANNKSDSDYQAAKVVVENRINQVNKGTSNIQGSSPASNVLTNPLASLEDVLDAIEKTTDPVELEQLRELELAKRLQADTKNLKDTNNDVLKGNKAHRNLGINDYNQAIAEAIETKDAKLFERTMNLLDKWSKTHRSKADAVKQAYQNFLDGNPNTNVYRSTDGTWFLSDKPVTAKDRDINRALAIGANSMNLVNTINSEADTIDASYDAYVTMAENGLHGKVKTRTKKGTKNTKPINTVPNKTVTTQEAPKEPVETPKTPSDTSTPTNTQEAPVEQIEATEDVDGSPEGITKRASKYFEEKIRDNNKNIIKGPDTGIPDSEFEADSGNFVETADGKEELVPELKKVANGELFAADYEQALEGSNKFIGFGSSKQAWRTKQAFGERANAASTRGVAYTPDDVVFIHADNNPKNLSPQSLARDGIHQAKNTNYSFTDVRKMEVDAAIAAGSTIKMIPPNMRKGDKYVVLNEIAAYLESKGYVEDKGTFTKTAKKKVEPETKVETPTQENQTTPTEPEVDGVIQVKVGSTTRTVNTNIKVNSGKPRGKRLSYDDWSVGNGLTLSKNTKEELAQNDVADLHENDLANAEVSTPDFTKGAISFNKDTTTATVELGGKEYKISNSGISSVDGSPVPPEVQAAYDNVQNNFESLYNSELGQKIYSDTTVEVKVKDPETGETDLYEFTFKYDTEKGKWHVTSALWDPEMGKNGKFLPFKDSYVGAEDTSLEYLVTHSLSVLPAEDVVEINYSKGNSRVYWKDGRSLLKAEYDKSISDTTSTEPKAKTKEETKSTVEEEVETTPEVEEETSTETTPIEEVSYSLNDVGPKGKNSPKNQGTTNHMTNGWWSSDWTHKVEEKQPDNEFTTTEESHVDSTGIERSTSFTQKPTRLTKLSRLFTGLIRTKNKELIKEVSGVEVTDSNIRQLDSFIRLQALFTQNLLRAYDPTAVNEFDQAAGVSFLANLLVEVDEFGNTSIPEHVVTAMTKSVYQNIQKFGDNVSVDEAQLRSILGLPENATIPLTVYNKYKDLGQNRQSFYQEIGAAVMRDLGINPTKEAKVSEEYEMAASIGMWVEHVASNYESSGLYTTTTMTVYEKLTDIADHMDAEALKEAMAFYGLGKDLPHNATKEELELELYNKKSMLQAQIAFIRPNIHVSYADKDGNPRVAKTYHKLVLDILQSSKHKDGSEDLIEALLSEEKETKKPLEEPIKEFKQNSIKNTRQSVPRIIKDMLSKVAQTVWGIRTEQANTMINLYDSNKEQFFAMFGIQSEESLANEHPLLREKKLSEWAIRKEALEAKIDWLKARQIKDEDGNVTGYKTYFMKPVVYSNHRIGYESTLWNAQSDKFDRMLTRLEEWETSVNASEALLKDGVSTVHGRYLRALAETMEGITKDLDFNTEYGVNYDDAARTVDKIAPIHFMNPFKEYLDTNEELHTALDAAEKMIEGVQLTSEEVQIITQYLDKMDAGDMAVGTLIELVKYRRAKETGSTFTTDISSQSDGVTNGPVTTQILYGIATLEGLMKQGGVLSADEDTNFFDQKARGEKDYYQDNAAEQVKKARDYIITPAMKAMVALINQIDKSFGERKGAKILVTPFNYGAGFRKLKSAVVKGFESSMEKKFYSIYSASDKDQALAEYNSFMKEAVDQYNRVFKGQADTPVDFRENVINLVYLNNHQGKKPISFVYYKKLSDGSVVEKAKTPQQLLEDLTKNLDAQSLKAVEAILRGNYKEAVHKDLTLDDIEGDVPLAHRKVMKDLVGMTWGVASVNAIKSTATEYIEVRNEVTALTGHAFNLYDTLKNAYMERLGKQYHEMTLAEVDDMYKYLSDYSAVVDSAHSAQMGGNNGASGLLMANETLQQNNDVEVKGRFKPMNRKQGRKLKSKSSTGSTSDKTTQKSSKVMWRVETEPASRGMALQIQSTDSRVSLHTVYRGPYMNFHDANPGSIADMQFVPMVQNQNKAYFDMLVGYDAHLSMVEGLLRPLRGIIHEIRMGNAESLNVFKLVYDTNYGTDRDPMVLTQYISANINKAFTTEINKLKTLKKVKVVHQYAGAEGPYYVTEEDIKTIDAKIARLEKIWDAMAERYNEKTLDKIFQDEIEKSESQEAPVLPEITSQNEMAFAKTGEERQEIFDKQITSDEATLGSVVDTLSLVPDTSTGSVISELLGHLKDFQDDFTNDIPIKNVSRSERPEIFQNSNQDYFFSKIDNTIYVNSDVGTYSPSEVSKAMFRAVLHNNFMAFKNGSLRHPNLVKGFKVLKQVGRALHYGNEYDLISISENLSPEEFKYITEAMQKYVTSSEEAGGHFANAEALMELVLYDPTARNIFNKITVPDTAKTLLTTIKDFIASVLNLKNPTKQAAVALGDLLFETSNYLVQGTKDARGDMTLQEFIDDSFLSHENNTTVYRNSEITPEHGLSARFEFEMARLRRKAYGGPVSSVEVLDMLQGLVENAESITTTGQKEMELAKQTIELIRKYLGNNVDFVFVGDLGDVLNNEERVGNSNTAYTASVINDMAQGRSWHIPHAKGSTIYMPLASITDITNTSPTVALHELVHGFTAKSMRANKDSAATKAITALYQELQPLMADFDAHKNPFIEYASTNVDEFLAESLTNENVKEFIVKNSDKVDAKKLQKLLQAATGVKQEGDLDILTSFYSMVDALGEQNKQEPDWVELPEPSLTPVTGITSTAVYNMGLSHSDKDMRGLIHPSDVQRAQDQLAETNVENNSVIEESDYFVSDNTAPIPFEDIPYDDLPFEDYTPDHLGLGDPYDINEEDYFSPGPQGSSPNGNRQQATLFSPQEVFDNLETDTDNQEELDRAMRDFVNPLLSLINPELLTGYDIDRVWHDAVLNNEAVFVSDLNAAGFDLSDQQAFVLETIETAVYEMLDEVGATRIYRQLLRTYQAAKASVRPQDFHNGDWNQATPEEKSTAQDKYNEIFNTPYTPGEDKSHFMAKYIALSAVSPEFRDILDRRTPTVKAEDRTNFEKVIDVLKAVMDTIYGMVSASVTPSSTVIDRTDKLASKLVKVYQVHMDKANRRQSAIRKISENVLDTVSELPAKGIAKAANAFSKLPYIRNNGLGKITQQAAAGNLRYIMDVLDTSMDDTFRNQPIGELRQAVNEVIGTDSKEELRGVKDHVMLHNFIQQKREEIVESIKKQLLSAFHESNQNMSKEQKAAVTKVLLRTDAQKLMNKFGYNRLIEMLRDPSHIFMEVAKLETTIEQDPYGNEYIIRSKMLADYMVHRAADKHNMLAKNANAIVERFGLDEAPEYIDSDMVDNVDTLVSLYALLNTKPEERAMVVNINSNETTNSINGLKLTLETYAAEVKVAEQQFKYNPWSIQKGYLPNIVDDTKGFEVIHPDHQEDYERMGFIYAGPVKKSSLENTGDKIMMILPHNGNQKFVSGAISTQDTEKSGKLIFDSTDRQLIAARETAKAEFLELVNNTNHKNYTRDIDEGGLIPSYNENGDIISFSYEMTAHGLDKHLKRNNDFTELVSQYAGGNDTRQRVPTHNKEMIDFLNALDASTTGSDRNKMLEVGPDAPTEKGREYWALLPSSTKNYVTDTNGQSTLWVRKDMANTVFGFTKYNPSEAIKKERSERNFLEMLYGGFFELFFGEKAELKSNTYVAMWQELIKKLKSFEVIRNWHTFVGNVVSNEAFLMINGFEPIQAHKDLFEAAKGSLQYQRDVDRLNQLKNLLRTGNATPTMISELQELRDSIARNPLSEFIRAGMMPTIVNDVSLASDDYTFQSTLEEKLEGVSSKVPGLFRKIGKTLLMSEDTAVYKFMAQATQQSDFIYKYAVYKQELRKGKSKQNALRTAREMFIEYDVPTSKGMQFLNDMGVWTYTKFAFRVQRVLFKFVKEKAGALILTDLALSALGFQTTASLFLYNSIMSNPLRVPIWDVITMADESMLIQLVLKLFM